MSGWRPYDVVEAAGAVAFSLFLGAASELVVLELSVVLAEELPLPDSEASSRLAVTLLFLVFPLRLSVT
ncbi:MAG: hypothetical protein R3C62_10340 [Chloroflexota bacterium]